MSVLIRDYETIPGEHCGSTAMRSLLHYYCGLELSEPMVFGLGSGIDCLVMRVPGFEPSSTWFGRSVTLEVDVASALGVDYRERPDLDDDHAWEVVKAEVDAGRPTMLSGDSYYLDHREFHVHFPSHRFVLVGYDENDGVAFLADRLEPGPGRCTLDGLRQSRNPPSAISTFNQWGKFYDTETKRPLVDAIAFALRRTVRRMNGEDDSQRQLLETMMAPRQVPIQTGLSALGHLTETLARWHQAPDASAIARYAAGCIDKYGTGGGFFRRLFSDFLAEAAEVLPELEGLTDAAGEAADRWSALGGALAAASKGEDGAWSEATTMTAEIADREAALFEDLSERTRAWD